VIRPPAECLDIVSLFNYKGARASTLESLITELGVRVVQLLGRPQVFKFSISALVASGLGGTMLLVNGRFYEFHRRRVVSRPGQPFVYVEGMEIGREIFRPEAFRQARSGLDVYTPSQTDAYRLALSLNAGEPIEHPAANPLFYPHYHAGGVHLRIDPNREGRHKAVVGPGHIFFGRRGCG